jgi:cob(I)alamin adenosyltransferase
MTRGLIVVNTGDGKGKTTAALGMMLRAMGHNLNVIMFQFIKKAEADFGEHRAARRIGMEIVAGGGGFTRRDSDTKRAEELARNLWAKARAAIASGRYDMVVLDELTYPLNYGWLAVEEVIGALKNRPEQVHIVITGRRAPKKLIAIADTVTQMRNIKHALEKGIKAQAGMEF